MLLVSCSGCKRGSVRKRKWLVGLRHYRVKCQVLVCNLLKLQHDGNYSTLSTAVATMFKVRHDGMYSSRRHNLRYCCCCKLL